jgi:hypothetical protein
MRVCVRPGAGAVNAISAPSFSLRPKFVEQRLRLSQIARVEAFGRKPEQADLVRHPACPGRARAAPYSSPRAVPKILLVVDVQLRERPRNTLSRYNTSTD